MPGVDVDEGVMNHESGGLSVVWSALQAGSWLTHFPIDASTL